MIFFGPILQKYYKFSFITNSDLTKRWQAEDNDNDNEANDVGDGIK